MTQITADQLPRSNHIKEGTIAAIPTAEDIMENTLHSKLLAIPALLAFTLTEGDKDPPIGLLSQVLPLLTVTTYEELNTAVVT